MTPLSKGFKFYKVTYITCLVYILMAMTIQQLYAQELEPRSISNVPIGTNFVALNYTLASGNILYDPSLSIEDLNANTHAMVGAYIRSFNFLGMGAKFNVIAPYVYGDWEGNYQGVDTATSRSGMADLRFGFSFNFIGSPALKLSEFKAYEQKTIAGFSLQTVIPTGQYFSDKLINIGSNRYAFRPQLGISHRIQKWYIETSVNVWLFTKNDAFFNGNALKQKAIGTIKLHLIKAFKNDAWVALVAGYANGGRTYVNGDPKDTNISTIRFGGIATIPINKQHSIKLMAMSAKRFDKGADFDAINITYQYVWNNINNK